FQARILRYRVPSSSARTIYVRFGDWFPWAAGLAILALLGASLTRRGRRHEAPTPPAGERGMSQVEPAAISGGADPRVLVVLPTYEERATIATVVTGVLAVGPNVDVLVVDDDSPDGTGEVVAALAEQEPRVRLLRR